MCWGLHAAHSCSRERGLFLALCELQVSLSLTLWVAPFPTLGQLPPVHLRAGTWPAAGEDSLQASPGNSGSFGLLWFLVPSQIGVPAGFGLGSPFPAEARQVSLRGQCPALLDVQCFQTGRFCLFR